MSLCFTVMNATQISDGVWIFEMPPHQIRHLGAPASTEGDRSVLLLRAATFEAGSKRLIFSVDDVAPLNLGTSSTTISVLSAQSVKRSAVSSSTLGSTAFGPGDREFLALVRAEMSQQMAEVAQLLLEGVRKTSAGDLKRGLSRNFSETPDNFWYVIVQPRIDELSITVRGPMSHFRSQSSLQIKDDRGNTRFKVTSKPDVAEALKLISRAIRKPRR